MTSDPVSDPFNLERFVIAQALAYPLALRELRAGFKASHWMWYVFPQFAGLGRSEMSARFAIRSLEEARAYLAHAVLGPRLLECSRALLDLPTNDATGVMGTPDDHKLRSSATLFAHVSPAGSVFHQVLEKYFGGSPDAKTLALIGAVA